MWSIAVRRAGPFALALLAGCQALPRDMAGTSERVRATHVIRVGVTQDIRSNWGGELVGQVAADSGARAEVEQGNQEWLLSALEKGYLDLVVTRFEKGTPWADKVKLAPPLPHGDDEAPEKSMTELRAATRNGENRWAMLVERETRAVVQARGR